MILGPFYRGIPLLTVVYRLAFPPGKTSSLALCLHAEKQRTNRMSVRAEQGMEPVVQQLAFVYAHSIYM